MQALTNNNHLVAYGTAFMLEAVLLVGAFIVIDKLDMTASQAAQESELIATGNTAVAATD